MGKIANAIERSMVERKLIAAAEPLQPQDLEALLNYDQRTGMLNIDSSSVVRDPDSTTRLIVHKLISPSGKLTKAGIRKCEEVTDPGASGELDRPLPADIGTLRKRIIKTEHIFKDSPSELKRAELLLEAPAIPGPLPAADEADEEEDRPKAEIIIDHRLRAAPASPVSRSSQEPHPPAYPVDESLVAFLAQNSVEAEQFKILRTGLLYPISGTPPRSILVTSVAQGDGKSFVSANLAVSMALSLNRHVLLIDCDLRKPSIHTMFGFGDVPGLTEYISKGMALPSLLLRTKVERLTILPAGTPPQNPSELLSSKPMASLVQEVTRRYDDRLIILDSPPPTLTAEPVALARQVDGILFVVRCGKTRMSDLQKVVEKMGKEKLLGSVVNHYEQSIVDYYGYRKYSLYGHNQQKPQD